MFPVAFRGKAIGAPPKKPVVAFQEKQKQGLKPLSREEWNYGFDLLHEAAAKRLWIFSNVDLGKHPGLNIREHI